MSVSVEIENLIVKADGKAILDNVSCRLEGGRLNALIGPNGAGKTTLIHALLGFVPYEGAIRFSCSGQPRTGFVPQQPDIDRGSPLTVEDYLIAGLARRPVWLGKNRQIRDKIISVLEDVGVADRINRRLGDLSGGEFQRILLAQALLRQPELLLLDEPQTGVDITGAELFCGLIENVHKARKMTTLLVTHDLGAVADHADRIIGLNREVLFEGRCPEELTGGNLERLFGPHAPVVRYEAGHVHNKNRHIDPGDRA